MPEITFIHNSIILYYGLIYVSHKEAFYKVIKRVIIKGSNPLPVLSKWPLKT